MAITPRILVHNPAVIAVASVTIFGLSIFASDHLRSQSQSAVASSKVSTYEIPCRDVAERLGDIREWQEPHWAVYTQCFQERADWRLAESTATDGLQFFPYSEVLHNMKAISQINQGEFRDAVRTLEVGLGRFKPTTGTAENNLAWASLWVEGESLSRARRMYQRSLQREAGVCEVLHTGLMVEFAISQRSTGVGQAEAYRNFLSIRRQYKACEPRVKSGEWHDFVEVSGAYTLFNEIDRSLGLTYNMQTSLDLRTAVRTRDTYFPDASFSNLCLEAIPTQLNLRVECKQGFETRAERIAAGRPDARIVVRRR